MASGPAGDDGEDGNRREGTLVMIGGQLCEGLGGQLDVQWRLGQSGVGQDPVESPLELADVLLEAAGDELEHLHWH